MLNASLKSLTDGTVVPSVELLMFDGPKPHIGRVYVYWPFVAFKTIYRDVNITHAPTGKHVMTAQTPKTVKAAKDWIAKLKACGDWNFTSDNGKKARRVRRVADTRKIIPRLVRLN